MAGSDFPAHEHIWEILLVADNPVGVTCKVCDKTVQMSEARDLEIRRPNVIDLDVGAPVTIKVRGQALAVVIDGVQQTADHNGNMRIELSLRSRDNYLKTYTTSTVTMAPNSFKNMVWK